MSYLDELKNRYPIRRTILIIVILAIVLVIVFLFSPLICDLIFGGEPRVPSEQLHGSFLLVLILNQKNRNLT